MLLLLSLFHLSDGDADALGKTIEQLHSHRSLQEDDGGCIVGGVAA
jgi:hypothetical protein